MDIQGMLRQAQEMQRKMQDMQSRLADIDVTGTAGGGMVSVVLTGKADMKTIKIAPAAVEDIDMLEDLIVAAYNDAKSRVESTLGEEMKKITGGMPLPPGLKF